MPRCECTKSGHGHDGTVCHMPIDNPDIECLRCGATTGKTVPEENTSDDMGLGD